MSPKIEVYKGKILKELCFGKRMSASELSLRIQRSLPVTMRVLDDLVKEGMIFEKGFAPSTGGRRPQVYALAPERMYAVAIAMDQLITKIALVDLENFERLNEKRISLSLKNNPDALKELISIISTYLNELTVPKNKILGVGIGMPGFIDLTTGVNYSFLDNNGKSIPDRMQHELGLPVYMDNDSSLIALAELKLGGSKGKNNVMVINLSWGIGLGMIVNGSLFRGYNGFAGEFSHIPLFNNNKLCDCGKMGCLETEASMKVLVQRVRNGIEAGRVTTIKSLPDDIDAAFQMIIQAALRGDQLAVEIISEIVHIIGKGVAILVHIMNPEEIVISGRGAAAGRLLLPPIQQALNRYCIPRLTAHTQLRISELNKFAELYGAAALVAEQLGKQIRNNRTNPENYPFAA